MQSRSVGHVAGSAENDTYRSTFTIQLDSTSIDCEKNVQSLINEVTNKRTVRQRQVESSCFRRDLLLGTSRLSLYAIHDGCQRVRPT